MASEFTARSIVKRRRVLWIGYWLAIFVATHTPVQPGVAPPIPHADKVVHFVMYALLVLLGARWQRISKGGISLRTAVIWSGIYLVYAGADEWLQQFVSRTPSIIDWLADATGVCVAFAIVHYWSPRPTISDASQPTNQPL